MLFLYFSVNLCLLFHIFFTLCPIFFHEYNGIYMIRLKVASMIFQEFRCFNIVVLSFNICTVKYTLHTLLLSFIRSDGKFFRSNIKSMISHILQSNTLVFLSVFKTIDIFTDFMIVQSFLKYTVTVQE